MAKVSKVRRKSDSRRHKVSPCPLPSHSLESISGGRNDRVNSRGSGYHSWSEDDLMTDYGRNVSASGDSGRFNDNYTSRFPRNPRQRFPLRALSRTGRLRQRSHTAAGRDT
ncbi:hypothetical protein Acr_00g0076480 [Actinidia rufa]|uniref:Uncharacterized protein n=1 Tax=Actinidia rufa TaxID=165716 RepID=A0A7J0DTH8_9ERIC|nr:hypothetical protein Acr_00g0076480 [Actinidia rufa]